MINPIQATRKLHNTMTMTDLNQEQALVLEAWEHVEQVVTNGENYTLFNDSWIYGKYGTTSERRLRVEIRFIGGNNWLYSGSFSDGSDFYQTNNPDLFKQWMFERTMNG